MDLHLDLHSHSGYAGGVGKTSFDDIELNMPLKGINIVGTGDCLHPLWKDTLEKTLTEGGTGLFSYGDNSTISYLLQTEIIITAGLNGRRKGVHTLLLFPSFESIERSISLLESWGMKNTVGRPFLCCTDPKDVGEKLNSLKGIDDRIEIIPAHVMTPEGVFGSKTPIDFLHDFYGEITSDIKIIETGLSADPKILSLIPELDRFAFISNSDAHSPALNRMGREFTTISSKRTYDSIISSLRKNKIINTGEFNPVEGRYFLTGHRAGRKGHDERYCVYSPKYTPQNAICPICGKKLTIGVYERALELSKIQGESRTLDDAKPKIPFVHMVPLVEIIAYSLNINSLTSKRVHDRYYRVTSIMNECDLWFEPDSKIESMLEGKIEYKIIDNILSVKNDKFCFSPAGYDGVYGKLVIGENEDYDKVCLEN